jgi:predicted glutamine amidotransferase
MNLDPWPRLSRTEIARKGILMWINSTVIEAAHYQDIAGREDDLYEQRDQAHRGQAVAPMCELLGLSSDIPATVNLSLAKLAEHGGLSGPHRDGWGVAYYEGEDVRLIKEPDAAANSDWVRFVRDHDLRSPIVVAHVRRATVGERSYRNTQPFVRELAGRMHLFAHNGWLAGIFDSPLFRSSRFYPVGETDSEQAFCALLEHMTKLWQRRGEIPSLAARLSVVCEFARDLARLGPANFLYSDGDALFGHGHRRIQAATSKIEPPGLFLLQRHCHGGGAGFATSGLSIKAADQTVTLLASVPLSDESWQPLGEGAVIAVHKGEIARKHVHVGMQPANYSPASHTCWGAP